MCNALLLTLATTALLSAQTPAPPRTTPPNTVRSGATSPALSVQVTDKSGGGLGEVSVSVAGPVERSGVTASDGTIVFRAMRAGTYRLRFEHDSFITLERELALRGPAEVSVALNRAAPKPAVVAPPPPMPAPPEKAPARAVEPRSLSIPDFLDKNLIRGSEPQKMTMLACTDAGTAKLLQVKEPLNNLQSADAEQLLYVVAGAGIVRVRGQDNKAVAGWFTLIPRGVPHSIRRDGRNPLIAIAVSMGSPCTEAAEER